MKIHIEKIAFALANRHRGLRRSLADVLVFTDEGLELWKGKNQVKQIPFKEVEQIRYTHFRRGASGMLSMLGGNLFGSREAVFQVRVEGETIEVALELDAEYRSGEIRELFGKLYQREVPLFEYNSAGLGLFLLEPIGAENRSDKLTDLISGSEPNGKSS